MVKHFLKVLLLAAFLITIAQSTALAESYTIVNDSDRAIVRCTYKRIEADGSFKGTFTVRLTSPIPPGGTEIINIPYSNSSGRYVEIMFFFEGGGSPTNARVNNGVNSTIRVKQTKSPYGLN